MPGPDRACLRCGDAMDMGYVLDHGHYNQRLRQKWVAGPPEPTFWSGLKTKDRAVLTIVTWRCRGCGWLDSYAP
jgi:hypothetical protein